MRTSDSAGIDRGVHVDNPLEDVCPLAPIQEGLLFHSLYSPGSGEYVSQVTCTIEQPLDVRAFERAWQTIVDRHSIFRTVFVWENLREPLQVVRRRVRVPLLEADWAHLDTRTQQGLLDDYLGRERDAGFDVSKALMRIAVIRLAGCRYQFVWTYHHLLMDGWSEFLVFKELSQAYLAYERNREVRFPPTRPYADYVGWVRGQDLDDAERFWRRTLAGFSSPTSLPFDRGRTDRPTIERALHAGRQAQLGDRATASLIATARRAGLTMNTITLGAWGLILGHYAQCNDVVFGATVAGRPLGLPAADRMVGLFINTLPARVRTAHGDAPAAAWLKHLQQQQAELRQYEFTPLVRIKQCSDVPSDLPLFESIFTFQNTPVDPPAGARPQAFRIRNVRAAGGWTNYPMTVEVTPGARLTIGISYDTLRFDGPAIDRILEQFTMILEAIAGCPDARLEILQQRLRETASGHAMAAAAAFERTSTARLKASRRSIVRVEGGSTKSPEGERRTWNGP